jgi:hypothetical protein
MPIGRERGIAVNWVAPAALMPAGALAVHQLRYWLAFGNRAGLMLQRQGHSYLHSVAPWIVLLIAVSAGVVLRALGRAVGGRGSLPRYTLSFTALWLLCAACLVVIYAGQEFLEGLFATGHPAGLVGIFGYGGGWSVPAALAVGLVLAAIFYGFQWVLHQVGERRRFLAPVRPRLLARVPQTVLVPRVAPLANGWSDRGPPARCS